MRQSATVALNQKAKDLQAAGKAVINLTAGEPDFYAPEHVKRAGMAAIEQNYSFYTAVEGCKDLRMAISRKLMRDNGLAYSWEQIVVGNGAKHALANAILTIVDDGDEVVIPAPYWVSYSELVTLAGGRCIIVPTDYDSSYKMSAAQLEHAISPRTKALILCSPCNPTGAVYSREELSAMADVLAGRDGILVISDEIYEHINYTGSHASIASAQGMQHRTAIINGVSKAYAMTGYRIGYVAAPQWWSGACAMLQGHLTSNASSIAQMAAAAALTDEDSPKSMAAAFLRRRAIVMDYMRRIPRIRCLEPQGAFYVFPDVSAFYGECLGGSVIGGSQDMCLYLLEHALVAAVPGSAFGDDRCIRISFAASDANIEQAMQSILRHLT
jgi:aspartate aminotransferase